MESPGYKYSENCEELHLIHSQWETPYASRRSGSRFFAGTTSGKYYNSQYFTLNRNRTFNIENLMEFEARILSRKTKIPQNSLQTQIAIQIFPARNRHFRKWPNHAIH